MEYKYLLHITYLLISSPARAWEEIRLQEHRDVSMTFVYPMIGFAALFDVLGILFDKGISGPESYQIAMTECCAVVVSLFGGFFLSAYGINMLRVRMLKMNDNMGLSMRFVGYAMVVQFLLQMLTGILPDLGIISMLLQFYVVYIVWEGSESFLFIKEESRLKFTVATSVIILFCPALISYVFRRMDSLFVS